MDNPRVENVHLACRNPEKFFTDIYSLCWSNNTLDKTGIEALLVDDLTALTTENWPSMLP